MLPALVCLALLAGPAQPGQGVPSPPPPGEGPVILFLVDNSASLPPLDPEAERVAALEKMFGFLKGYRYRLVLFGAKSETFVDDVSRYRNDGQWTDFYHAFAKARELAQGYPKGTEFKLVLVTDAIVDPDPADWSDVPPGWDVRSHSMRKTVELVREMQVPLYVMLIGDPAGEVAGRDREQSPGFVLDLVQAANGAAAAPLAQTVAAFFQDDGVLLRKFVYRVAPDEGLAKIEPVVRRITAPPRAGIEFKIFGYFVLPAAADPGGAAGPAGAVVPRPRRPGGRRAGGRQAGARGHGQDPPGARRHLVGPGALAGGGPAHGRGDIHAPGPRARPQRSRPRHERARPARRGAAARGPRRGAPGARGRHRLRHARGQDPRAEPRLRGPRSRLARGGAAAAVVPAERARIPALDFVRAKTHLALAEGLRQRLLEPRVQLVSYGKDATRQELAQGASLRIGRYGFVLRELGRGGRKDFRLVLYYDRVPSLLGLKTILPDVFQRAFRFRRSRQRVVS